jgi:hypothetical protein
MQSVFARILICSWLLDKTNESKTMWKNCILNLCYNKKSSGEHTHALTGTSDATITRYIDLGAVKLVATD